MCCGALGSLGRFRMGCRVWGAASDASSGRRWRTCVGCETRSCVRLWASLGHWVGSGRGESVGLGCGLRAACRCSWLHAAVHMSGPV